MDCDEKLIHTIAVCAVGVLNDKVAAGLRYSYRPLSGIALVSNHAAKIDQW